MGGVVLKRIEEQVIQGNLPGACLLAEQAIAQGSQSLALRLQLTGCYLKSDRYQEAAQLMANARNLVPASPPELIELAKRLLHFTESEALSTIAKRLFEQPLWHAAVEADLAAMVSMIGDQATALSLLERAIVAAGAPPAWLYNRSQMHMYSGRFIDAENDLRACLRIAPATAKAHWALSKLPSTYDSKADVQRLQALSGRLAPASQDEVFRQFALFNQLDRLGRIEPAWTALAEGNRIKRTLLSYDADKTRAYFQALIANPVIQSSAIVAGGKATLGSTPIFIVGMHRTGTTLLEQLLGNHPDVMEAGELYDFPAQLRWAVGRHFSGPSDPIILDKLENIDFASLGSRYLNRVCWRVGDKKFLVDKLPSNFINIGYIRAALPHAKVIHMSRNPMDTCFSNLKELFGNACAYSYGQAELAHYYQLYRQLMAHWRTTLPDFVLDVSYEALTENPAQEAQRIFAFCGLDWQPHFLEHSNNRRAVNTASSAQVREPIHRRNIEAWKRYAAFLTPLQVGLDIL